MTSVRSGRATVSPHICGIASCASLPHGPGVIGYTLARSRPTGRYMYELDFLEELGNEHDCGDFVL